MKKALTGLLVCLLLSAPTAWGQEGIDFYELGLKSSTAKRKIYYFTKALELNPALSTALEKRGMLYYFQGKYNKAIQDFSRVTELKPLKASPYGMLGLAHMKSKDYDEAIAYFTRVIELDQQLASGYSHRAQAYLLKGMTTEAIENATKAIGLGGSEQTTGRAYTTRAKAYRHLGQIEFADEDFQKAMKMDPEFYVYTFTSPTEILGDLASESSRLDRVSRVGVVGIIILVAVIVFKLAMSAPKKDDQK